MKPEQYLDEQISSLKNKTIIVTGANSGIGFETTKMAAYKKARVVLACRSEKNALRAIEEIKQSLPEAKLEYVIYDQASFKSIDSFVETIIEKYPDFDSLFLNAGILKPKQETYTKDGFPLVLGTNFYGVYYLLEKLSPFLKKTKKEKRVIIEGSLIARWSSYHGDKYDLIKTSSLSFHAYNISKIGLENLFYKSAKENKNKHLKFILSEPGICKTDIIKNFPSWIKGPANSFFKIFTHSPMKGSLCSLHAMSEKHDNGDIVIPSGLFSVNGFPKVRSEFFKRTKRYERIIEDTKIIIESKTS